MSETSWRAVDAFLSGRLCPDDDAVLMARERARAAGLPDIEVSVSQAQLLALLCQMTRAKRILEFGTLFGYSAITMARAIGDGADITTFEIDEVHAKVARENFEAVGVAGQIELVEGVAADNARALIDSGAEPFDLVFIDADKPNNPIYVEAAIELAHPGTLIVVDNIVRDGAVIDPDPADEKAVGARAAVDLIAEHPRLEATGIQTVGTKGWDGFLLARVSS